MAEERTYLELSEEGGSSHKFYEVLLNDTQLTIRFGRIGDQGQVKVSNFPTVEKAQAEAKKKINEKLRKGYEPAVIGVRKKRKTTRRSMSVEFTATVPLSVVSSSSRSSLETLTKAPIVWKFNSGANAFGVFVDDSLCWVGNEAGKIFALDHNGEVKAKFKLPDGVKCIVADGMWLYAGCDDGNVYDLSGKAPRIAYQISDDVDIYWLDIYDSILAVSDDAGNVTTINHEDESQWTKKSRGNSGWMVRCDEIGIYHGHSQGVTMYDWEDGKLIWEMTTQGQVLFGWQEESSVYACTNFLKVYAFSKKGLLIKTFDCDAPVFSCAAADDGKYVFAGDNRNSIYCFSEDGERLWKLFTGCGSAYSMQYHKGYLYIVTTDGSLACIDASETAIGAAKQGDLPKTVSIAAPQVEELSPTLLETTSDTTTGVLVECLKEGGKLRVRVISEGYNRDWHCQFPKGIREEGAKYIVDHVLEARNGGFYRVLGNIKKLTRA
ncbi:MAG: WGR domain-containing protein [Blastocatellia bacterium]|nr:WGR domain-containing protein [Blastocatellia bacterium]